LAIKYKRKEKRMRNDLTEVVAILDRSGSMANLANDTIGGFNRFIEDQKKVPGEAVLTTVLFDDRHEFLHDGANIQDVKPITGQDYFARGMTALLDAVGRTINRVGEKLSKMNEADRPSKVIVLIITDGAENSSREFTHQQIREMIERQQNTYKWEFLFFGANIDSFAAAASIGIPQTRAVNHSANKAGVSSMLDAMSLATSAYRGSGAVPDDYRQNVK
jgi:uncharacterized protein YegL